MKVSVRKLNDAWRTAPWVVRYYVNRKAVRRFFETKEEAEQHAREVRETLRIGTDPEQFSEANRLIAGTGLNLTGIIRAGLHYIRESDAAAVSPTATFGDGVKLVLDGASKRRVKTQVGYRSVFSRLDKEFGSRIATSITGQEVDGYLNRLADCRGVVGNATPDTKRTMLRHIRMVLRAVGIAKPLPKLEVHVPRVREIRFFSVEELRRLLVAARPKDRGFVALAVFAAIRPETLERMPTECVKREDMLIRIPGELSKDHRAHCLETVPIGSDREIRPGPPPVLWAWLERYPFRPRRWSSIQRYLRQALGGLWIHDGLRHSGATFYRAKYGDAATAELLTHASIAMVNRHYAGLATRAQAEEFFALSPQSLPEMSDVQSTKRKVVQWPPDDELTRMLEVTPGRTIATSLGCSDSMLSRYCKSRGIPKPSRGHWSKAEPNR